MKSYQEATARQRIRALVEDFTEYLPPSKNWISPHLAQLNAVASFDDGISIGHGHLGPLRVYAAAQEGGFMGGAVGEVHGAKLVGLLRRAVKEKPDAVILLVESGGVRLHEANAGLIAVSEVMRAVLEVRAAKIPVVVLIGGSNGCFGGMGIVSCCANTVIMSEEARLGMSGPEVIETAQGVEEFDSRDRALVWRITGGKHRFLIGDCQVLVEDEIENFRKATVKAIADTAAAGRSVALSLDSLESEQKMLFERLKMFGEMKEPMEMWKALGIRHPDKLAILGAEEFMSLVTSEAHLAEVL